VKSIKACNRHSHTYHIEPATSGAGTNAQTTAVRLFYRDGDAEQEQLVARFRNLTGTTIFDKYFAPAQPSVPVNHGRWDAIKDLDNNWKSYADAYQQNHRP
jgi:hypothetical protein